MVTTKLLLPATADVGVLGRLAAPLRVYQHAGTILKPSVLYLVSLERDACVRLAAEYDDVVFKFEIFNLQPRFSPPPKLDDLRELPTLTGWNTVKCVVAYEWERPAQPGEVPPSWEQLVGERGPRTAVPENATAIGISMVGVIFHDLSRDRPVGMLYSGEDDPAGLSMSQSPAEINAFTADREIVAIDDFPSWRRGVANWLNSLVSMDAAKNVAK